MRMNASQIVYIKPFTLLYELAADRSIYEITILNSHKGIFSKLKEFSHE